MIIVIDYDAGNTANVLRALEKIGVTAELSADKEKILAADGLILPGVGAYPTAMAELERRGLVAVIKEAVKQTSPLTDGLDGQAVYFVHSYFTDVPSQYIDVTADYSIEVPAMIHKDNVYGAQFHPEKSGDIGLGIIEQFVGLCKA